MDEKPAKLESFRDVFWALIANDAALKLLFDHLRNIGISAAVFAAAGWKFQHIAPFAFGAVIDWMMFTVLVLFGLFLFVVNQTHGMRKLRDPALPPWVYTTAALIYSIVSVTVIFSVSRLEI